MMDADRVPSYDVSAKGEIEVPRRKRRQGTADDVMDAVALLPWWGGVVLALASYIVFHAIATQPLPTLANPQQLVAAMPGMFFRTFALALQYVLPMLCLLGAVVSFLRRRKREALVRTATASASAEALNDMSWAEFEILTAEAFRLQGFDVKELGGAGPDGGVDLEARRGNETFLVQCKQWKAFQVGVDVVRELYGVMAARGAAGGYVVTSGTFTDGAVAFAQGRNVKLVDGKRLHGLLQQARTSLSATGASLAIGTPPPAVSPTDAQPVPKCPTCNASMVRRTARKGAAPGSQFWGCSNFPVCRGTR